MTGRAEDGQGPSSFVAQANSMGRESRRSYAGEDQDPNTTNNKGLRRGKCPGGALGSTEKNRFSKETD